MNCKTCEYNLSNWDTGSVTKNDDVVNCKYQICPFKIKEERRKNHKCNGCKWGTFTGTKYFCILPRCIPKLGSFNGVDKNGPTKKNT